MLPFLGCLACSGAGAEGGAGLSKEEAPVCSGEMCCIPVMVDVQRFRAYWFQNELYFDVFAQTAGEPDVPATHWSFEAQVTGEIVDPIVLTPRASYSLADGISFIGGHTTPHRVPACGETLRVEVRLSSSTYDELGRAICTANGLGPTTTVEAVVECPTCPGEPQMGTGCNHPRGGSCPAVAYNHWSGENEIVSCSCGTLLSIDEPRTWGCPVF